MVDPEQVVRVAAGWFARAGCTTAGPRRSRPARAATWPASSPKTGPGVTGFSPGDQVLGFTHDRASHADLVVVDSAHLIDRPEGLSWEAAGSLFVAGTTAYASVRAVGVTNGDVVIVSAAAGGAGSIAVQLATYAGAAVIGLATPTNHDWLREHDVIPVAYGNGVEDRIRAAAPGRQGHHRYPNRGGLSS
ncbi:MAG TPA: hypothetical protein VGR06_00675 [Actinophytocola sp.]|uniref:hypothetical protein n=1 Tax=Actinophytocola sp. TaxID=1872138 RepID=UPI002E09E181|nr:hypothetical protein [Actinophytocola sp.]